MAKKTGTDADSHGKEACNVGNAPASLPSPDTLIDRNLVAAEWPKAQCDGLYFNNGSCSIKPQSVVQSMKDGWERLNRNPTLYTFFDEDPREDARFAAAELFDIPAENLLLIQNSTYGLQLILQSFLLKPGDELVTTNHEHGCINTLCRYLQETRGIVVRRADVDPLKGSVAFTKRILDLVGPRTRLVEFSEIDCYTGWRPAIDNLASELNRAEVPFVVDGAHVPGQGPCSPKEYPLWVASGHKWLGGPNSTGFLYANSEMAEKLVPLCLGDRFFDTAPATHPGQLADRCANRTNALLRLEWQGTADPVRWAGLHAAIRLQQGLGPDRIAARQLQLVRYLRQRLSSLPIAPIFRTRDDQGENCGMVSLYWQQQDLLEEDLRAALWAKHRIWVQQDGLAQVPGFGMRLSCPVYLDEADIDNLVSALEKMVSA